MSEFSEAIKIFIEDVAKSNGLCENVEIESKGGTAKGDNYISVVKFIQLRDKNNKNNIDLVLKTAHTSEILRKQMPLNKMYLREIFFYETLLPKLLSFQKNHNIKQPFTGAAKMYGYLDKEGSESIILEDLRTTGFKLWNRKLPMNPEHVEIVLREYARYHAISFAFKHLYPGEFADLSKVLKDIHAGAPQESQKRTAAMIKGLIKKATKALGGHPARKSLEKFEEEFEDFYFKRLPAEKNQLIITHGDCWCNNMMFKYGGVLKPKTPTKVCFLDFQLCKLGMPVMDLAYFLCVSASKDILVDFDKYLNIYYKELSKNIREFGCDPEKIYSLETFKTEWQKYAKLGVVFACSLTPLMLKDSDDAMNIAETAGGGKDLLAAFSTDKDNGYNKRIYDLITTLYETKVL